jgi:ATPase family associated with various cellular activities (AAA)
MPTDQPESFIGGFTDNWAYLKAELQWLDRVLMLAVARQRKETKEVDRVAHSKADRATSHWWKGLLALEGNVSYDEHRPAPSSNPTGNSTGNPAAKLTHQQQMEQRIKASRDRGVVLALPVLCDRLCLTLFEKNLVLMSLAPELNRRYGRLYHFLQGEDPADKTDLPSLDLALRLLCRNDAEWRVARNHIVGRSPLMQYSLLRLLPNAGETRLNSSLKLHEALVDYLIAEQPTAEALETLLQTAKTPAARLGFPQSNLRQLDPALNGSTLILPAALLESLQYLAQQVWGYYQAEKLWQIQPAIAPGKLVLLTGAAGTGKTMSARTIASVLQTPLFLVDLAQVSPEEIPELIAAIDYQEPTVLLIKSAQRWLGRSPHIPLSVSVDRLQALFARRRRFPGLTLLSAHQPGSISLRWRQQMDRSLTFSLPEESDRLRLWKQAFSGTVPLSSDFKWKELAKQLTLSGGEIQAIAQETIAYAAAIEAAKVGNEQLLYVLTQRGLTLKIRLSKKRRSTTAPLGEDKEKE